MKVSDKIAAITHEGLFVFVFAGCASRVVCVCFCRFHMIGYFQVSYERLFAGFAWRDGHSV